MTIRVRFKYLVFVGFPVLLVLASLVLHDDYWPSANPQGRSPGLVLFWLTATLVVGWALSFSESVKYQLSRSQWSRLHYVKSNSAQATVALWLGRTACVVLLWGLGIFGILGRFSPR